MTVSILTVSVNGLFATFSITIISIKILSINGLFVTLSITTFSITTLSINEIYHNDTQNKGLICDTQY